MPTTVHYQFCVLFGALHACTEGSNYFTSCSKLPNLCCEKGSNYLHLFLSLFLLSTLYVCAGTWVANIPPNQIRSMKNCKGAEASRVDKSCMSDTMQKARVRVQKQGRVCLHQHQHQLCLLYVCSHGQTTDGAPSQVCYLMVAVLLSILIIHLQPQSAFLS